jgi:D-alanine-D-alanine ligase
MVKSVAVFYGGWSVEREVSLASGLACADALESAGYSVSRIDVTRYMKGLVAALTPAPDVVFNALHGRFGEDGAIQGLLDMMAVPYTHSGVLASALAMHKQRAKIIFKANGIPCPDDRIFEQSALADAEMPDPPYVIKPVNEGSSVGVHIIRPGDNRPPLDDWPKNCDALVEPYIPGRELTVVVMGGRALGVTELRPLNGFYDYEAKYTDGKTEHLCPAPVPDSVAQDAMNYAETAHRALGCRGVSRADFRYDDCERQPGALWMLEVNTQPGMTPLSLAPEQAAHAGIDFPQFVGWMVENAACDA